MKWGSIKSKFITILLSCFLLVVMSWTWSQTAAILIWYVCVPTSSIGRLISSLNSPLFSQKNNKFRIWRPEPMLKYPLLHLISRISTSISVFVSYKVKQSLEILKKSSRLSCLTLLRMSKAKLHLLVEKITWWFWNLQVNRLRISNKRWESSRLGLKIEESALTVWDTWEVFHGPSWLPKYARSSLITNQLNSFMNFSQSSTFGTGKCQSDYFLLLLL